MDKNNTLGFLLGAALGGVVAYYALKHQDEILNTINNLDENFDLEHNTLINQAKAQLEQLTQNVKAAITQSAETFSSSQTKETNALLEEIDRLRAEVERLKTSSNDVITS